MNGIDTVEKTVPVGSLPDGASFKHADCAGGGTVTRATDCGAHVRADDGKEHVISNGSPVVVVSSGNGVAKVGCAARRGKGRPKELNIVLPDGPFTIKMVSDSHGCSVPSVFNFIKKELGEGRVRVTTGQKKGGKGKPAVWYEKAIEAIENTIQAVLEPIETEKSAQG